mmetsp:Transcript_11937/g.14187  ORF Transcript_11937/g.14187 Transcript_11937/m.14187 type:complete len:98 (+) Transcript_11937:3-296(+)
MPRAFQTPVEAAGNTIYGRFAGNVNVRQEEELFEKTRFDTDSYVYLFGLPSLAVASLIFFIANKPKGGHLNRFGSAACGSCGVCGRQEKEINLEDYF